MIPLCMLLKNLFFSTHEGIEPDLPQFECDVFINLRRVVDSWDGLTQKRKKTGSWLSLFNQRFGTQSSKALSKASSIVCKAFLVTVPPRE